MIYQLCRLCYSIKRKQHKSFLKCCPLITAFTDYCLVKRYSTPSSAVMLSVFEDIE